MTPRVTLTLSRTQPPTAKKDTANKSSREMEFQQCALHLTKQNGMQHDLLEAPLRSQEAVPGDAVWKAVTPGAAQENEPKYFWSEFWLASCFVSATLDSGFCFHLEMRQLSLGSERWFRRQMLQPRPYNQSSTTGTHVKI